VTDATGATDTISPFLDDEPPIWAARGLAYVLLALFATGCAASIIVNVPETIRGRFVLAPVGGTDPVRALRAGAIAEVHAIEGGAVTARAPLFVIRSQGVGDRSAELAALRSRLDGAAASMRNAERQYESERRADEAELTRLTSRVGYLAALVPRKREQLALAQGLAASYQKGKSGGAVSDAEYGRVALEAHRLSEDVAMGEREVVDTRAALEKLRYEVTTREAQFAERQRSLRLERDEAAIRASALESDVGRGDGSALSVLAPCAGTVVRLRVNAPGTVVQEGETLGEVACAGQPLRAEMTVPASGVALLEPGQRVKLLYDAFPYQRYGVRTGVVHWLGPTSARGDSAAFRAFIDVDTGAVRVRGQSRPLVVGMGGRADIVVGRRSLVSYAFEPIRQLRESVSDVPDLVAPTAEERRP
jgi:membrane fusion protein